MTMSTRRFLARPSGVSSAVSGAVSAKPTMAIRRSSTPKRPTNSSIIAILRAADSSQLLRKRLV